MSRQHEMKMPHQRTHELRPRPKTGTSCHCPASHTVEADGDWWAVKIRGIVLAFLPSEQEAEAIARRMNGGK